MSFRCAFVFVALLTVGAALMPGEEPVKEESRTEDQKAKLKERDRLRAMFQELARQEKAQEAIITWQKAIAIERDVYGPTSEQVVVSLDLLAKMHEYLEDFTPAKKVRQEIFQVNTSRYGKEHWQTTDSRLALEQVDLLNKLDKDDRARLSKADEWSREAMQLRSQGKYPEAIARAKQVAEARKQLLGENHHDYALGLNSLGILHHEQGDYSKAEPLFTQAQEIWKVAIGTGHPNYAQSLNNLGALYVAQGDYARAEPLLSQALKIQKQAFGENHELYAQQLFNLGALFQLQADYMKADVYFREASEVYKLLQHPLYSVSLNKLANVRSTLGRHAQAEQLHQQALEIHGKLVNKNPLDSAVILNDLALNSIRMGDYGKALPLLLQALEIYRKTLGEKHPHYCACLNNLGELYRLQGDLNKAGAFFQQASQTWKQVFGEKHPAYAGSLSNLALLYQDQGDYGKAEEASLEALVIRKQALGEKHPDYAGSLNNLAGLYVAKSDYRKAEPLLLQAIEILKATSGDAKYFMGALVNLAAVYQAREEYSKAEECLGQVLRIEKQVLGEKHPSYAGSLNNLAVLYRFQGDYTKAETLHRRALAIAQRQMSLVAAVQSQRQQLEMGRSLRFHLETYLSACQDGKLPALLGYCEMLPWKGSVLAKQRQLHLARREPMHAPLAEELRQVSGQLATLAFATPTPQQREALTRQIVAMNERKERLEAELADKSVPFREGHELVQLTPEQLQRVLPADTILVDFLEYWHTSLDKEKKGSLKFERRLTAFVLPAKGDIVRLDLGPAAPIARAVDNWRTAIVRGQRPTNNADDPANVLRKLVWQPLEGHMKDAKLVLLSPDGAITKLPFAALPGSKLGTYVIEEHALVVVPVPQLLPAILKEADVADGGLLTIGDVEFGGEAGVPDNQVVSRGLAIVSNTLPTAPEAKRPQWSSLAATGPESDAIGRLIQERFPKAEVKPLRKEGATEAAFRQLAPKHRYLHIATHGFFADEKVRSALYPSEKQADPFLRQQFGDKGFIGHNPELLSGLVLAGANSPIKPDHDDGILTALEIRNLDLDNVELTVLSACETGLGAVAGGEGVLGLQRAFQAAGARTVVTSLWQIPDQPTQLLMQRFYANLWQKKMSKIEALREAQLWMLREGCKHPGIMRGLKLDEGKSAELKDGKLPPLYWAAFVLSGDWR